MAKIAVIGTGYVGLTTGACFAHMGHKVVCADIDPAKVDSLSQGVIPIVELGLQELVEEGIDGGRLSFVLGAANAAKDCEIAFLCVPTPQGDDGSADLSYIEAAAREIGPVLPYEAVVVNKSTVPVGSAKVVERVLGRPDVKVVSNPEFLREGSAVQDFLNPDRVVVGCDDQAAALKVSSLYDKISAPVIITDPASAETIKYAANAFLATKSELHQRDRGDLRRRRRRRQRRRRRHGLATSGSARTSSAPGPGWGGSCFPKDSRALLKIAREAGYHFDLLDGVIAVNDEQFDRVADKIRVAAGGDLSKATVAVWGLTFKARTDDLRDSPSLAIIKRLVAAGATVQAFDPTVNGPKPGLPDRHHRSPTTRTRPAQAPTCWPC